MTHTYIKNAQPYPPGSIREMISLALPMIISLSCDTLMVFTDRLFLAKLGPEFMNAAMAGGLTSFMMTTFFLGLTGYTTALTAHYLGARRKRSCARVTTQALLIALAGYPIILVCRPLAYGLFQWMGILPQQLAPQKIYFDILLYATIITLARNCLSSFFSGMGRTKIVMISSFSAMGVNIFLNYLLIFGNCGFPALGIRGAAYGTIIGSLCALLMLIAAYFYPSLRREYHVMKSFYFDWHIMKKLLRFGYPAGIEMFLNLLAFNMLVMLFHTHSLVTGTAATIMFNWDLVSFLPLLGVEIAVTSLIGRYKGAGQFQHAHRSVVSGLKLGYLYSACIFVLFLLFPHMLVELFKPQGMNECFAQAKPIAIFMLQVAPFYVFVEALFIVFIGALRGAGDTLCAMYISVGLHWLVVVALFISLRYCALSAQTAWVILVFIFFLFSLFPYLRYRSGKWKTIKVIEPVEPSPLPADLFHEESI